MLLVKLLCPLNSWVLEDFSAILSAELQLTSSRLIAKVKTIPADLSQHLGFNKSMNSCSDLKLLKLTSRTLEDHE